MTQTTQPDVDDTSTNKRGTETCTTEDCLNNYTPYILNHDNYCVTCANDHGVQL